MRAIEDQTKHMMLKKTDPQHKKFNGIHSTCKKSESAFVGALPH